MKDTQDINNNNKLDMSAYVSKKASPPHGSHIPETVTGEVGSAKRNIIRKGGGTTKLRKDNGAAGKNVDDGSTYKDPCAMDQDDPNFDSEEDFSVPIPKYSGLLRDDKDIARSKLTLTSYKKKVEPIIKEFFVSCDVDEVVNCILEIEAPEYSYEFVKRMINMSLDQDDRVRESVSKLMSDLYPDVLSSNMIGKGFERLFEIVDEIEKDAPNVRNVLTIYLARAVMDEIIPPSFLSDSVVMNLGDDIVENAKLMLSRDHAGAKLEKIWGPGDGRPVEELKVAIDQLVQEFLLSKDIEEAVRCILELNCPLFHHELVKRAIVNVLDKDEDNQLEISRLFGYLHKNDYLSSQQADKGLKRVLDMVPDLILDTPNAEVIVNNFTIRAKADGIV